ncbi:hypothetical protein MY04_05650 [Flammeovirga sp. MY04]|nr:hypothetical protein [Flammeovirga sp. MY04]QJD09390.1 hypothetical protein MY04_05650 [Flammeovirga sp. MY04]
MMLDTQVLQEVHFLNYVCDPNSLYISEEAIIDIKANYTSVEDMKCNSY